MASRPLVSVVFACYNRREAVLRTIAALQQSEISDYLEIIAVDNHSTDGTPDALAERGVHVIRLRRNAGSCAKAAGAAHARGEFLLFLDDDSRPQPGSLLRMLDHFAADPELSAAGFRVHLPDGRQECSALPHVFVGCGVGLRRSAYEQVGGLDGSYFMQGEEYDLAFRLLTAGGRVRVFDDLHVDHDKTPHARYPARVARFDTRNNLRLMARYLPATHLEAYWPDWLQRYRWIATANDCPQAFRRGAAAGALLFGLDRLRYRQWRLPPPVCEQVFSWSYIQRRFAALAARGVRSVVLADLGKNVYAFYRASRAAGVRILAIADDFFAAPDRRYRDVPILPRADAAELAPDAWIVSNTSFVHAERRRDELARYTSRPVHAWFDRPAGALSAERASYQL